MRQDIVFQIPLLGSRSRFLKSEEQEYQDALLAAGKRDARQGSPVFTVLFALFVTAFLLASSMDSLINNFDDRIFVTTTDTFSDYFSLRDVFAGARNYSLSANPRSLTHGFFDPVPDTEQEWQDLRNRRLISSAEYDGAIGSLQVTPPPPPLAVLMPP